MNPASSSSMMCELDKDTLIEILSRLPVKSLVRFMSVCRLWKSIITNPQFRLASNRPTRFLVHTNRECYAVVEDEEVVEEEKIVELVFESDFPLRHLSYDRAIILGSYNGLICIEIYYSPPNPIKSNGRAHRSFIIWNPSIRKHVVFPDNLDGIFMTCSIGFGATNSGLDYKLVKIVGYTVTLDEDGGATQQRAFHIYSLKSGTWRRIDLDYESYLGIEFSVSPAFLRGRLHWVVHEWSSLRTSNYISTLELEDEVFENNTMMLPQQLSTGPGYLKQKVTVIKESLAVIAFEEFGRYCSLWVMQEYGYVGSWVKLFIIDQTISNFNVNQIETLGVLKNGNLLLRLLNRIGCPSKLVTWDPNTMKTNDFGGGLLSSPSQLCGFTNYYKESFVLLADFEDRAVPDHKV